MHRHSWAIMSVVLALVVSGQRSSGQGEDPIDRLLRDGRLPREMMRERAHSDFSESVGKFMDFLAAGAFDEARALRPAACAAWRATRHESALTGRFWVWNTELDLDMLCPNL